MTATSKSSYHADPLRRYRNKVFHADIFKLLQKLPDNSVDMVYGDPDYNVGIDYHGKQYKKKWDHYIDWYTTLTREALRVLKPTGNIFLINYPKQNAYLRVKCLDKMTCDVFEYVWVYNTNVGHSPRRFTTAHRSILHITKTKRNHFYKDHVWEPYKNPTDRRIQQRIQNGHKGRMPYSWFYFNLVKNVNKDKTFHACQIPQQLAQMLIKASTKQQDDCLILFGGSGSEILLCRRLKRHFISAEAHKAYHIMIQELLASEGTIQKKYRLPFIRDRLEKVTLGKIA